MTGAARALPLLALVAAAGCERGEVPAPSAGKLPPGVVARAGASDIHAETVTRVATAQDVSLAAARERALSDALFAERAREVLPAATQSAVVRGALARAVLEDIRREAARQGPPTHEEVEKVTSERWVEIDRPPARRVSHAVAQLGKDASREEARRVAAAVAEAVRGVSDPEQFLKAARGVPAGAVPVRAERLPPMTADGRGFVLEDGSGPRATSRFDEAFARAAFALTEPGDQSGLVETRFGFHVILLEALVPERRVPFEERRQLLAEEIDSRRGAALRRALLERLAAATPVSVGRDVEARTAELFAPAPR